ncbi:hypothetical protein Tco_0722761 [Tanacetum coccineum]
MNAIWEYVNSLEKELDELESEKADFSNIYDLLLEECVSKDVTCSYLHSLSDLNANTELQCLYLHKVKECGFQLESYSTLARARLKGLVPQWYKRRLIAADQASVFMAMTSDHNRSELGIQDHSNEQSSQSLSQKLFLKQTRR